MVVVRVLEVPENGVCSGGPSLIHGEQILWIALNPRAAYCPCYLFQLQLVID